MMNRYRALLFPFHLVNLPQLHKRRMVRQRRTRILCASCATCDRGTSSKPIQESNLHLIFYQILRDSSVAGWPHLGVTDFVRSVVYIQSELKRAIGLFWCVGQLFRGAEHSATKWDGSALPRSDVVFVYLQHQSAHFWYCSILFIAAIFLARARLQILHSYFVRSQIRVRRNQVVKDLVDARQYLFFSGIVIHLHILVSPLFHPSLR